MGREIRRVPPDWQHPLKKYCTHRPTCDICYQPLHDETYEEAANEWIDGFAKWLSGERPSYFTEGDANYYWDWDGMPPNKDYYRTYKDEEATWFQVYETVSEGTPVTPPFETKEELVEYLVANGDFWDQRRKEKPPSRKAIENFVFGDRWVPSLEMSNGVLTQGIEIAANFKEQKCK